MRLPLMLLAAAACHPAPRVVTAPELSSLGTLVGRWTCESGLTLDYRFVSADTALVETYTTASGRQTLTIFHRDGQGWLATHYCAQGNQPRLRLASVGPPYDFRFQDVTNLATPAASHLTRLQLSFPDADHYQRVETYEADGKPEVTTQLCSRLP